MFSLLLHHNTREHGVENKKTKQYYRLESGECLLLISNPKVSLSGGASKLTCIRKEFKLNNNNNNNDGIDPTFIFNLWLPSLVLVHPTAHISRMINTRDPVQDIYNIVRKIFATPNIVCSKHCINFCFTFQV